MLKKLKSTKTVTSLAFVISLIYFGIFRFLIIPSGDDYFWWGDHGAYLLRHHFYGPQAIYGGSSNGRYVGNLLEIFTMHHQILAILAYAFGWTLLIWCIWKLSGKSLTSLLLAGLFTMTLQTAFVNNVLVWNAGFVNYVPPLILIMFYLIIVHRGRQQELNRFMPLLTLVISYIGGFFTEGMTLTAICLGVLVLLYFRKKAKLYHLTYLVGAIISAITMFSHRGYHEKSIYHQTTFDPNKMWDIYSKITHFWIITFNVALLMAILVAIIVLALKANLPAWKKYSLTLISIGFIIYYIAINFKLKTIPMNDAYGYNVISGRLANIEGIVSLIFIIFIGYAIFTFFNDPQIWCYFLLTGVVVGQLLFVQAPINCRGYFPAYAFMYLIAMRFVLKALSEIKINKYVINLVLLLGLVVTAGTYQYKLHANYEVNLQRVNDPKFYNQGLTFTKHVPYRHLVWTNDLTNQQNPSYWKLYLEKHHYDIKK